SKQIPYLLTAWIETTRQILPANQLVERNIINATDAIIPKALLHELFTHQVQIRANNTAIISSQGNLTYQELFDFSNQVAHRLRRLGVTPNKLVGVVMEKGWEQIVAVMGISISGAAYVPIDPKLPQERFLYFLENSQVDIVLTQSRLKEKLSCSENIRLLCIDSGDFVEESKEPLESVQTPDDLAYVIYTSGSTGLPKGVAIAHRGAVNTILDINQRFGVNSNDRVLALSSLSFDLSVYDIFGILADGGGIVVPEAKLEREPENWVRLIAQHNVTIWNSVPALMQMLVDYGANSEKILASLRLVLLSGDWIPLNLPTQITALMGNVQVVSLGGATEASIWSILYPISEVDPSWTSIPYGRPMTNQRFYVLNHALEPCPVWVPGKLYIAGVGVALGYWRNETKTATSFITHPKTGERLYYTGDNGRYLPNGNIEFMGREDFQVKVGGYRIELGEIEATLLQHKAVDKVVVNVIGEQANEKRLFAYIVLQTGRTATTQELRYFVGDKLPDYMVPSAFIFLDALPLSANGKVDRRALPVQDSLLQQLEVAYVPPQTDLEKIITGIWQDLLGVEKVGVNDNFFDLGGNSLLLTKIYSKFLKVLPKEFKSISIVELFKYSTIRTLAQRLTIKQDSFSFAQKNSSIERELKQGKNRLKQRYQKSAKLKNI
ncbi:MAG: amino acid adenylation domain-containing protein, partial [Cyanobacteria bacterium J06639_18]